MQKMKNKIPKSIIAVFLCIVMCVSTVQFALARTAAEYTYDPVPTFADGAYIAASYDDAGGVTIDPIPTATGVANASGVTKTISGYIIELVDLGETVTSDNISDSTSLTHTEVTVASKFVAAPATTATFAKSEISSGAGVDSTHRYSVTVEAVDSENWFSKALYTIVSTVEEFNVDLDVDYTPIKGTDTTYNVREVLDCEGKANGSDQSSTGNGNSYDYLQYGQTLSYTNLGAVTQAGAEYNDAKDAASTKPAHVKGQDSLALGFKTTGTAGSAFDTTWSRIYWNGTGTSGTDTKVSPDEVWFWIDVSQVTVNGLSFQIRANEKTWWDWADGTSTITSGNNDQDRYGTMIYSTLGTAASTYTGEAAYVYILNNDGAWKKVMLTNGKLASFGSYRGYIRIPIKFMCSTENSYATVSNLGFGEDMSSVKAWDETATKTNIVNYFNNNGYTYLTSEGVSTKVLVDPAGTSVKDALLMQERYVDAKTKWGATVQQYVGRMISPGIDGVSLDKLATAPTDRAYIEYDKTTGVSVIKNRDAGFKAIEDFYSAGFAYDGMTDDSVNKMFFLDNVMFYKNVDSGFDYNGSTSGSTSTPVTNYYDQKISTSKIVYDYIDNNIGTPDAMDYKAVAYIQSLMQAYTDAGATWMDDTTLAATAALTDVNRSDSWNNYLLAKQKCKDAGMLNDDGTVNISKASGTAPVEYLAKKLEKLPDIASVTSSDEVLSDGATVKDTVAELYRIYNGLNLYQLSLLGSSSDSAKLYSTEEGKLISYFKYLSESKSDKTFVTGSVLAENPYIMFNDFETNYTLGDRSWQLENDDNAITVTTDNGTLDPNVVYDYRHTQNLTTYTTQWGGLTGRSDTQTDNNGNDKWYQVISKGITKNYTAGVFSVKTGLLYNNNWADITDKGYNNSQGATVSIDGNYSNQWCTVAVTRQGASTSNFTTDVLSGTYAGSTYTDKLGSLAVAYDATMQTGYESYTSFPLCVAMYVDFSELSNFNLSITLTTNDGTEAKTISMSPSFWTTDGNNVLYYALDPETGNWATMHAGNLYSIKSQNTSNDGTTIDGGTSNLKTLDGFKGYIMIPLKWYRDKGDAAFEQESTELNGIWQVSVAVDMNGQTANDNKTFTVDNIGFSYPAHNAAYATARAASGITDKTYGEIFKAKSTSSTAFENAVANISIYDADLSTKVAAAQAIYDKLDTYQRSISTVVSAKSNLETFDKYVSGELTADAPVIAAAADLVTAVDALPTAAKNAVLTGDNEMPYPGITYDTATSKTVVNYSTFGFADSAAVQSVIDLYEKSYLRYSPAVQATVTNSDSLIKAYNAARRCQTLEKYISEITDTTAEIKNVYLSGAVHGENYYMSLASMAAMETANTAYNNMSYFAKQMLLSMPSTNTQFYRFTGAPNLVKLLIRNGMAFTPISGGSSISGGILTTQTKYQALLDSINTHYTNKTVFTATEISAIQAAFDEYGTFIHGYSDIKELYDLIAAMKQNSFDATFDVDSGSNVIPINITSETAALTNSTNFNINYSEHIDDLKTASPLNAGRYVLRIKSDSTLSNTLGDPSASYSVYWNGSSTALDSSALNGTGVVETITDNVAADAIPLTVTVSGTPQTKNQLSGKVYVEYVDTSTSTVISTYEVPVTYQSEATYSITIPADITINWDDTSEKDVSYTVDSAFLPAGHSLTVGVSGTGTMASTKYSMSYTSTNFANKVFDTAGSFTYTPTGTDRVTVKIPQSSFDSVAVAEYKANLTYTVTYS